MHGRVRLLVVAVFGVVLLLVARAVFKSGASSNGARRLMPTASDSRRAAAPQRPGRASDESSASEAPSSVPPEEREVGEGLPTGHDWGIAPPTASWVTAPANPIAVDVTLGRGKDDAEITAGGGVIKVNDRRAQYTLYVPPAAVLGNQPVTITVVDRVEKLPFASGLVSAVQIAPANARFLKRIALTIQPRQRGSNEAAPRVAGFAIEGAPAELHLYPVILSTEKKGRVAQDWQQFSIHAPGIYGVAAATEAEVQAVSERVPSSPMARVEAALADAMLTRPAAEVASAHAWTLFPTLHAQVVTDEQKWFEETLLPLVQRLRDYYDQILIPKLQKFKPTCDALSVRETSALQVELVAWIHAVQVLGLADEEPSWVDKEEEARIRDTMPVTYHILQLQRASNDAYFRPIIQEFEQKQARLWSIFWDAFKAQYVAIVQCCAKQPKYWMPGQLLNMQKVAEGAATRGLLGVGGLAEAQQCSCGVAAVFHMQGWTGTITHTYTAAGDSTVTKGVARDITETDSFRTAYTATIAPLGGSEPNSTATRMEAFASVSAHGEREEKGHKVVRGTSCRTNEGGGVRTVRGDAHTVSKFTISFLPDGRKYLLNYPVPVAYGIERFDSWGKMLECDNQYSQHDYKDFLVHPGGVTGGMFDTVHGESDSQLKLQDSQTFDLPDKDLEQHRHVTVKWELNACQAR